MEFRGSATESLAGCSAVSTNLSQPDRPGIIAGPLIYGNWGNFFEQFSLVSAALIVYASATPRSPWASRIYQTGRYCFGVSVISFTLEQLVYLSGTGGFVPR